MTKQELFNKIAKHLLNQGKKAQDRFSSNCRYLTEDGLKCAVGCLIPSSKYDPLFEGIIACPDEYCGYKQSTTTQIDTANAILKAAGLRTKAQQRLARSMQRVHDWDPVARWIESFRWVAKEYKVSSKVVDSFEKKWKKQ